MVSRLNAKKIEQRSTTAQRQQTQRSGASRRGNCPMEQVQQRG
jgi:hypothetical protein